MLLGVLLSCAITNRITETPIDWGIASGEPKKASLADEIRALIETGTPPSLLRALDLLRNRDVADTELGRTLSAIAVSLFKSVYPALVAEMPQTDIPVSSPYAKILKDAEKGIYTPAPSSSQDFFEMLLPFIALLNERRSERLAVASPDIDRAMALNGKSVLPYYFKGIILERTGQKEQALALYVNAYQLSIECYPAGLAIARIYTSTGKQDSAVSLLTDLISRYPENWSIKRELAVLYYQTGNWSRAEPALAELLQRDPKDRELLLMRISVLIEQGKYIQAAPLLDAYGSLDNTNTTYLYLRARLQAEGYRNRDAALTFLRSILRINPSDPLANTYMAKLLIESDRESDRQEGETMLDMMLKDANPPNNVLELAVLVTMRRQNWSQAQMYNSKLLEIRRSVTDLSNEVLIQQGLKKFDQALLFAKELYDKDLFNEQNAYTYALSLINAGKREEARLIIDAKLNTVTQSTLKSKYFYLRSRMRTDEETVLNDLRSSLFEDPRNLDALIAMLEIYHRRKDERRAVYYLKQALSLSPDNPILQPYKKEYANQLN
ncbi:MAG: tetratricopeptide repeat protein [Treponema sp.]|nr:tetratricopeptide repeat protein [Treponema sp.]